MKRDFSKWYGMSELPLGAQRVLHPAAEHVLGCWWRRPGAQGRDTHKPGRTGMGLPQHWIQSAWVCCCFFPVDHLLFVLHTRAPSKQCLCGVTRLMPLHPCAEVRGCVLTLTGWGSAIHCVGLDNFIFYVKQSQKLEQMPLW